MDLETWTAQTIPECFDNVSGQRPHTPAVVSSERTISYGELAQEAALLADALMCQGVREGERVVLLLPDDIPLVIGWLGALKAGAVCVPLSVDHPEERLRAVLLDAEPKVLVTHGGMWDLALRINIQNASLVNLDRLPAAPHGIAKPAALAPESHAYILYTSGTTGGPKGVIQTHRNLLKNVRSFSELMKVSPEDRLVGLTAFSMGQGVATMFVSLLNGATLYPYHLKVAGLTPLIPWCQRQKISIYTSSVTVFRQFASAMHEGVALPHLRVIRLGTEELRTTDVDLFKDRFPRGCVLLNCLGSTETFNYARFRIDHDTLISGKAVPVGLPPEGTILRILNAEGDECEEGEVGEIVACSAYLSPGYWRDAELTTRRFHGEGRDRSYRTGDLGRRLPDGSVEFAGRVDHLVKIRGNRVELGEVEHVLTIHPAITAAAVVLRQDGDAEAALVAHVATPLSEVEVRSYLKDRLPDFMVPSMIHTMAALPLTPSGKADREALRTQTFPPRNVETFPEEESRNAWETAVAECWSRVLGGGTPGLHDEFTMVGGDSLKAMRLFAEIQVSMGITFDLSDVSEAFTVASMARIAETRGWDPQAARVPLVLERNADWKFLVRVQTGDGEHPFVIVPGGWGDETEILLLARVVSSLQTGSAIYAVRSRAKDPAWSRAGRLREHVAGALEELQQLIAGRKWILIGECVAATTAMELASQAETQGLAAETVIMLDPYTPPHPRAGVSENEAAQGQSEGLEAYYRVMKSALPGRIQNDLHVILASNSKNADHASEYWQHLTAGRLHLGEVGGTHESYLRRDGAQTVALLNEVLLRKTGTAAEAALGDDVGRRA